MRKKVFTLLLFLLFVLGTYTFLSTQKENSVLERRTLSTNDDIKINNLIETVSGVLNDQIFVREGSIILVNKIQNLSNNPFNDALLKIKDGVVKLDDEYFINEFLTITENEKEVALNKAYNIQEISKKYGDIKTYVYYPTKIEETTLLDSDSIKSIYPSLREEFNVQLGDLVQTASLTIDSVDSYKDLYYKTDWHWNGNGAYEGYKDIVKMISKDFEIGTPRSAELYTYDYDFFGGYAQKVAYLCDSDRMIDVKANIEKEYKYYVNGVSTDVNKIPNAYLLNGNTNKLVTDYEYLYEVGYYETKYDFNQPDRPNILVFNDSFIGPIKTALASHFNKTVLIDMRVNDGSFSLDEYINKYDINIILFTQYYNNLYFNGYLFVPLN